MINFLVMHWNMTDITITMGNKCNKPWHKWKRSIHGWTIM